MGPSIRHRRAGPEPRARPRTATGAPNRLAKRDEIGAGVSQHARGRDRVGISDTRGFKDFGPPAHAFDHRPQVHRWRVAVRLPEHHVIRPNLARAHRLIACAQRSRADNPFRFQVLDRRDQIRASAADMNPIRAKSRRQSAIVLDQERTVGSHCGAKDGRHDGFRIGLRHRRETEERASDRRSLNDLGENPGEGVGAASRQERSDEIERATRGVSGGQQHGRRIGSKSVMSPTNAAKLGVKARLAGGLLR